MTQAEEDFLVEFTRVLLVQWCAVCSAPGGTVKWHAEYGGYSVPAGTADLCMDIAIEKGWVSKNEPRKVLAKGYAAAAAFLRR